MGRDDDMRAAGCDHVLSPVCPEVKGLRKRSEEISRKMMPGVLSIQTAQGRQIRLIQLLDRLRWHVFRWLPCTSSNCHAQQLSPGSLRPVVPLKQGTVHLLHLNQRMLRKIHPLQDSLYPLLIAKWRKNLADDWMAQDQANGAHAVVIPECKRELAIHAHGRLKIGQRKAVPDPIPRENGIDFLVGRVHFHMPAGGGLVHMSSLTACLQATLLAKLKHFRAKLCLQRLSALRGQKAMAHTVEQNLVDCIQFKPEGAVQALNVFVQGDVEQRRIVGIDAQLHAGAVQARQWMRGKVGIDAQADIAARTNLQRDTLLRQVPDQVGIFNRTHAMPDTLRAQGAQRAPYAGRPGILARVRYAVQSLGERSLKPGREILRRIAVLIATQTERDHSIAFAFERDPRGKVRALPPLGLAPDIAHDIKNPAHLHAKIPTHPLTSPVQSTEIGIMIDAQWIIMRAGRERHLRVANILTLHLLAKFIRDQFVVLGGPQAARNQKKDFDKVIEVAIGKPLSQARQVVSRQRNLIAPRQRQQRLRANRALQVDMQLGFGRSPQVRLDRLGNLHDLSPENSPFSLLVVCLQFMGVSSKICSNYFSGDYRTIETKK